MAVNKNSNAYIITYATVMVVVVALVLAVTSLSLQSRQRANAENEMKGAILISIGAGDGIASAPDKMEYIERTYEQRITENYGVRADGSIDPDADAFDLLRTLKKEYDKSDEERVLPVFVGSADDGSKRYVLPMWGTGLWGPLWGYLAMEGDWKTIYGVVFDHQGETPGLGAEIANDDFQNQFRGKSIYTDGTLAGIKILKGTGASAGMNNAVDAISGGTITSRGVEDMITRALTLYGPFIEKQSAGEVQPQDIAWDLDEIVDENYLNTEDDE